MRVFLSHSTKDNEFVQRLAVALEDADFKPWLCEVDIDRGENFVTKINEGLGQSDLAILVWSPHAADSAWTEQEWNLSAGAAGGGAQDSTWHHPVAVHHRSVAGQMKTRR